MASPTGALVVDASVAAKWHLPDEDHADTADAILQRFVRGELLLWAPDYIRYEVPAAITVATQGRSPRLLPEAGRQAIEKFLDLGLSTTDSRRLVLDAYPLVHQFGCALYDALYLALAQRLGIPFITADRRLYQRIGQLASPAFCGLPLIQGASPGDRLRPCHSKRFVLSTDYVAAGTCASNASGSRLTP